VIDAGGLHGLGASRMEGVQDEELVVAGGAGLYVTAKLRDAGFGPMSLAQDRLNLSFVRAGLHGFLRSFDSFDAGGSDCRCRMRAIFLLARKSSRRMLGLARPVIWAISLCE
jgi:hypothetical protein